MSGLLEVFRDLYLRGPLAKRSNLRQALIEAAQEPWHYDAERSAAVGRNAFGADILAFGRTATGGLRAAGLTLWSRDDGYYVPNIVPVDSGELGIEQYNAILSDFIERIVRPVASRFDYRLDVTEGRQRLEDWTSREAAQKLQVFSAAANKTTGASHPMDQRRWFDFIIAVQKSGKMVGSDHLARWLHEIEGWDEESAHNLAGQYETAVSLLQRYDETLS